MDSQNFVNNQLKGHKHRRLEKRRSSQKQQMILFTQKPLATDKIFTIQELENVDNHEYITRNCNNNNNNNNNNLNNTQNLCDKNIIINADEIENSKSVGHDKNYCDNNNEYNCNYKRDNNSSAKNMNSVAITSTLDATNDIALPYIDNNDDDNLIKCVFLCKFHAIAGPKIAAQVPENYITKDVFDTISRYIIPKVQLQRCFLSVSLLGKKILGYPVRIDNKLYARNAFYFNFCFVFAPTTRTVIFEPVVRKLTEYMLSMELSSKILSQCTDDTAQLTRLIKLLTQIRTDLNRRKMCMLQEGSTIIPLCVVPYYKEPPAVKPHVAAVLNSEFKKYLPTQWDLTTLRILPYINGFNHIDRIAAMADVALGLVLDCIKHLILLGVAIMVPVFQYSNVYRPTPKLSQLAKCKFMQQRCIEQCSKINFSNCSSSGTVPMTKAKVRDVFRMFASMAHGATFGELCVRFNPAALNINEKQMVLFGQLEGLIRRVDKYPITVQRNLFYDDEPIRTTVNSTDILTSTTTTVTAINVIGKRSTSDATNYSVFNNCGSQPLPRGERSGRSHAHHHSRTNNLDGDLDTSAFTPRQRQSSFGHSSRVRCQSYHFYNGLHSFDEICTKRGISCQQLESQLSKDRHVIVLLR